ncbi:MAG: MoaD/ThiS family protein [Oscillospiraceae bacterium]|nr:MoaD/ThiS family protein [Oscillospiraceae bacterium]
MIEVRFFATFRENRGKTAELPAEEVPTAGDILRRFGIPAEEVAILLINGFHSKPEDPVRDGDVVALFPPVGGG